MNKLELTSKLDEWINNQRLDEYAPKTLVCYRNAVQIFINWIEETDFVIDKELTIKFKEYLFEHYSLSSRNTYIVELNKFLKYLGLSDCTLKKFKTQRKTSIDDPLSEQEHRRMLRWANKLDMEDMYWIMRCFADSGIRVEELKFFVIEKILDSSYLTIFNKEKERTIILKNELRRGLINYCKKMDIKTGCIFISPVIPNQMLDKSTIWRRLKKIARTAKINPKKIHPHAWRHLFAKKAKESGIDLDELQDILGHADIKTTAIYTKTSNREKKEKMEKMKYKND